MERNKGGKYFEKNNSVIRIGENMENKVFISYSHKDEEYKNQLEEHLSSLKRNKKITTWNDRKLIPGQQWGFEISEHLTSSKIILFLISPSFLASDYCYEIEASEASKMHKAGTATLIPIVVRPCDWSDTPFASFQALPKDAKPICEWSNIDRAWLDVVEGLKKAILELGNSTKLELAQPNKKITEASYEFLTWIDDTEILLTHRKTNKVKLSDVYVDPDLEAVDDKKLKTKIEAISSRKLSEKSTYSLVLGDEQEGKTSLLKNLFREFLKKEYLPVYIQCKQLKKSNVDEIIATALKTQYINLELSTYYESDKTVILLDDFSEIGLNQKFRNNFIKGLKDKSKTIIIAAHESFLFSAPEIDEVSDFDTYYLLGFNNEKRSELIEKWVSLGSEECIDEAELFKACDDIKGRLNIVLGKKIVPPKPIYVLLVLQMLEAYAQQNVELTSYGHCYQELIYRSFRNAGIQQNEVTKYLNILTEFAWAVYLNKDGLNHQKLDDFFKQYDDDYILGVDEKIVIDKLQQSSIIKESDFKTNFKYPYLFYFFTAKKIADYLNDQPIRAEIQNLLDNLHREDYANILVFVTHHTKDKWIFDSIQNTLNELFDDQPKASLSQKQLEFMDEFISTIPELIMEQREIREEWKKHDQQLDKMDLPSEEVAQMEVLELPAKINKTLKGMEIAGQIIRNRHASMTRGSLKTLAEDGIATGLRFLNYFVNISDLAKLEIIRYIAHKLSEYPDLTNKEIEEYAQKAFMHLTYSVIHTVIKKIASAIGSKEAKVIYQQLETENPTPSQILLSLAIELQFQRNLSIEEIIKTKDKLGNNPVCTRILQQLVIQHTYMFPVGYKEKQQLREIFDMSVNKQRAMDRQKIGKA